MHTKKPWMAVSGLAPLGRGFTRSHVRVLGIVLAAALAVAGLSLAEGSGQASLALRGEPGLSLIGRTISGRRNLSLRGLDGRGGNGGVAER